jgi:predicted DsbA family dithiol-disulfide isomerase
MQSMKKPIKIDFVSDVSCPWCAIGLQSLQAALRKLDGELAPSLSFQPFELNPQMVAQGEDITEHLNKKYGSTPEQAAAARENIRARGEALGFTFNMDKRARIYNTFNAHRLLHWAQGEGAGKQAALKKALLTAYFTDGENPSDPALLVRVAASVGLDGARAQAILDSDEFADEVRAQESFYQQAGINSVPAIILNDQHLISGGQPPEVFEQALRQVAGL